jgi:hypothetical protein
MEEKRPTISGFSWYVEPPEDEGEPYYVFSASDEYPPILPEGHHATCYGGGLLFADMMSNAIIEQMIALPL